MRKTPQQDLSAGGLLIHLCRLSVDEDGGMPYGFFCLQYTLYCGLSAFEYRLHQTFCFLRRTIIFSDCRKDRKGFLLFLYAAFLPLMPVRFNFSFRLGRNIVSYRLSASECKLHQTYTFVSDGPHLFFTGVKRKTWGRKESA